jgi:hypothetical protein
MTGLSSLFEKSREAFHAFAGVGRPDVTLVGPMHPLDHAIGLGGRWRTMDKDWWLYLVVVMCFLLCSEYLSGRRSAVPFLVSFAFAHLVVAFYTLPSEASMGEHLMDQSFRRSVSASRTSRGDSSPEEDLPASSPRQEGVLPKVDPPGPAPPIRFASQVLVVLRTPQIVYRSFIFFSIALTSPINGPPLLLCEPGIGRGKQKVQADRILFYFGFLGTWHVLGLVPKRLEWVSRRFFDDGDEDVKKRRAGVLDLKALPGLPGKEDIPVQACKPLPVPIIRDHRSDTKQPANSLFFLVLSPVPRSGETTR